MRDRSFLVKGAIVFFLLSAANEIASAVLTMEPEGRIVKPYGKAIALLFYASF